MAVLSRSFMLGFLVLGMVFHGFFYASESLGLTFLLFAALGLVLLLGKLPLAMNEFQIVTCFYAVSYSIPILYAADLEQAIATAIQMLFLIPFAVMALARLSDAGVRDRSFRALVWCGAASTIVGLLFQMYRDQRLESVFQYANALAAFLLGAGLVSLYLAIREKRWLYWIGSGVNLTGLLLTYSRSTWLLWVAAVLASFILISEVRRKGALLKLVALHLASYGAAALVTGNPLFFWARLKSTTPGASEFQIRLVYWRDGGRMWLHHVFGTGGGGWSLLLPFYRSRDYYVRYVHNHYLQVALDAGIVGLVLFLLLLVMFYRSVFLAMKANRSLDPVQKGIPIIVTALLLHAGFDFDLSFPMLSGLLIFLMGSVTSGSIRRKWVLPPKGARVALVPVALLLVFTLIMTAAYRLKEEGESDLEASPATAISKFELAEHLVPWSNTLPYDKAKAWVLIGNETQNQTDYQSAEHEIVKALAKAPNQSLYLQLKTELQNR